MKLRDFGLLTDENIDPDVIAFLRQEGFDVWDVCENRLFGASDVSLLQRGFSENRVVVTHDSDFGTLAIHGGEPILGILYLRHGHIDPRFTRETRETILATNPELPTPFIIVAKRTATTVGIRIRQLNP